MLFGKLNRADRQDSLHETLFPFPFPLGTPQAVPVSGDPSRPPPCARLPLTWGQTIPAIVALLPHSGRNVSDPGTGS